MVLTLVVRMKGLEPSRPEALAPKTYERGFVNTPAPKKLFVNIKDPDDHSALHALRQICAEFAGDSDIVLVLGEDKKSAIRLPFKVNTRGELPDRLMIMLGKDCVVLR